MSRPKPSEWGKLSEGQVYSLLAHDFGRALFSAGLGHYELLLIWYVMERSWGVVRTKRGRDHWPDARPTGANLYQLAITWGVPRQRLNEAKWALTAKGIVVESPDGLVINKNADQWVNPKTGQPLLSPLLLSHAIDGRTRAKHQSDTHATCTENRSQGERKTVQGVNGKPCRTCTENRSQGERKTVHPHIEERAHGLLDLRREEEKSQLASQPDTSASNDTTPETGGVSHADCVRLARELFGEGKAEAIERDPEGLSDRIAGRWDSLAHALRKMRSENRPIHTLRGKGIFIANRITREGPPVMVEPARPDPAAREASRERLREALRKKGL